MTRDDGSWRLSARPEEVSNLRHRVRAFAEQAGVRAQVLDDLTLAVSEAVTNVVIHAYRDGPPGTIDVTATVSDGHLEVLVRDDGVGMRPRPDSPGLGLGLPLIASLAPDSRVTAHANHGTEVWMRFPRTS